MCGYAMIDDEEQQIRNLPARPDGMDADRTSLPTELTLGVPTPQPNSTTQPIQNGGEKHSCFLCLRGERQIHYAIRIPCDRSTEKRVKCWTKKDGSELLVPDPKPERVGSRDDDSAIYEKLVKACYDFHGNWKKWVPFYGIVDVRETEFHINAYVNAETTVPNRFEIHAVPLDQDAILKQCNSDLALEPSSEDYDNEGHCEPPWYHTASCPADFASSPCIEEVLATARQIKVNLQKTYLMRDCALKPQKADQLTRSTLDGMLLRRSPIMVKGTFTLPERHRKNDQSFTQSYPGIEIVLGWQTSRVVEEGPVNAVLVWCALAVVWIALVAGGAVGDQSLWVAYAQLIVGCLSLLVLRLK